MTNKLKAEIFKKTTEGKRMFGFFFARDVRDALMQLQDVLPGAKKTLNAKWYGLYEFKDSGIDYEMELT